jgi:hypothetical protein
VTAFAGRPSRAKFKPAPLGFVRYRAPETPLFDPLIEVDFYSLNRLLAQVPVLEDLLY